MTESELLDRLVAEGLLHTSAEAVGATTWSNGPSERYAVHAHAYDKVLLADRGSITFQLVDGSAAALQSGDRLDLPGGTGHGATVGPDGVRCLEAHLPAGRLLGRPRVWAGWAAETAPAPRA